MNPYKCTYEWEGSEKPKPIFGMSDLEIFGPSQKNCINYYIHDHLGNTRVTYNPKVTNCGAITQTFVSDTCYESLITGLTVCDTTWSYSSATSIVHTIEAAFDYYPYGKVLREYNANTEKYLSTFNERDKETGWDYRNARYSESDIPRFLQIDPLSHMRPSMSSYNYVSGNPIRRIDPGGALDGWVEGSGGEVFWDENTNSQEEFDENYAGKEGHKYVSDKDDSRSYTLPSGAGTLRLNSWSEGGTEDGLGTVTIDMSFIPSDPNVQVGWTQTFATNQTGVHSGNILSPPPLTKITEYLDGFGVQRSTDVSKARYYDGRNLNNKGIANPSMSDTPMRSYVESYTQPVVFQATSSVISQGVKVLSVNWGFKMTSADKQSAWSPVIVNSTSKFHRDAVQSLINR